ncbi:MAG TPA: VWA domain-containing protein [Pyrinomonadaceae bacterium]|nr:VWA domain-containing protein [Pyrinomonadaceae bacterium]
MYPKFSSRLLWLSLCCLTFSFGAAAQTPAPPPAQDVVRTDVELVQTDITVFDRHGKFVGSLPPEYFTLSVDGRKRPVSLISRITSGSQTEAEQLNALQATAKTKTSPDGQPRTPLSRPGRLIFFFVDDIHLSPDGISRSRKALTQFIEKQMGQDDQVAIVSSSGRIGFLQQLTDNRVVLHTAIDRLGNARRPDEYIGRNKITEQMVSQMRDANNSSLFYYLMDAVKVEFGMGLTRRRDSPNASALQARTLLQSHLRSMSAQWKMDTSATLQALRGLLESSANLPGRKLVFFVSDGFIVDPRGSNALEILKQLSQTAARTGAVIYSMDARGTYIESPVDASRNEFVNMTSRHQGVAIGETLAPREPLSVLAYETGGRAIFNSNSIEDAIDQAVSETSEYYVLAWRPETENERLGKARIDVSIEGRPDLRVRLRQSYFTPRTTGTKKEEPASPKVDSPEAQLLVALGSVYPTRSLPTSVSVGYVKDSSNEYTLRASMQLERSALNLAALDRQKAEVDVIGAAVDDRGLIYSFKQVLTVTDAEAAEPNVVWNQQLKVQPGLYQVRVAVRERQTGRSGSATQWIEIPPLDQQRFSMSSLFVGERVGASGVEATKGPQPIRVDVDHRFQRSSVMRFQTYIYNASRAGGEPNVWIQAQVLRGNERVFSLAPNRIPPQVAKDPTQLPYWTEIPLDQLPVGRYTLHVSATDRAANNSASQTINFSVE